MEKCDLIKLIEIVIRNTIWMLTVYVLEVTGVDTQTYTLFKSIFTPLS